MLCVFSPGEYEIECPRCRKVTRLGHGGIETLPRNYDLELVVDAMPPEPAIESRMLARQQSGIIWGVVFGGQYSHGFCSQCTKIFNHKILMLRSRLLIEATYRGADSYHESILTC